MSMPIRTGRTPVSSPRGTGRGVTNRHGSYSYPTRFDQITILKSDEIPAQPAIHVVTSRAAQNRAGLGVGSQVERAEDRRSTAPASQGTLRTTWSGKSVKVPTSLTIVGTPERSRSSRAAEVSPLVGGRRRARPMSATSRRASNCSSEGRPRKPDAAAEAECPARARRRRHRSDPGRRTPAGPTGQRGKRTGTRSTASTFSLTGWRMP